MLFFILPGLLMTWGLASLLIHPGDSSPPDNGEGTKVTTDLGDEDDFFEGNAADDTVISNGGDDEIYGYRGADVIALGDGDDIGHGGSGTDVIYGADGNDFLDGGSNDWLARRAQCIAQEIQPRIMVIMWTHINRREHDLEHMLNQRWNTYYDSIKDPAWPSCDSYQYWMHLPWAIKKEIWLIHTLQGIEQVFCVIRKR